MVYANRVAEQAQRRLCGLVSAQDDVYRETPPQTAAGRRLAEEASRLRAEFDCPKP